MRRLFFTTFCSTFHNETIWTNCFIHNLSHNINSYAHVFLNTNCMFYQYQYLNSECIQYDEDIHALLHIGVEVKWPYIQVRIESTFKHAQMSCEWNTKGDHSQSQIVKNLADSSHVIIVYSSLMVTTWGPVGVTVGDLSSKNGMFTSSINTAKVIGIPYSFTSVTSANNQVILLDWHVHLHDQSGMSGFVCRYCA